MITTGPISPLSGRSRGVFSRGRPRGRHGGRVRCVGRWCVSVQVQEQWHFAILYNVGTILLGGRYRLIVVALVAAGSSRATDPQTHLPMLYYARSARCSCRCRYALMPVHNVFPSREHECIY